MVEIVSSWRAEGHEEHVAHCKRGVQDMEGSYVPMAFHTTMRNMSPPEGGGGAEDMG